MIGVDIGGTFTDVVCRRPGEATRIVKIPSTPDDPARAVTQAREAAAETGEKGVEVSIGTLATQVKRAKRCF